MRNESHCKVLNICCLNQEMHELGIEPTFWNQDSHGSSVTV
jgi:hypothetical protein